jgi:hypothetical protein
MSVFHSCQEHRNAHIKLLKSPPLQLIDLEEEASATPAAPGDSWRQLESQGLLLQGAVLLEKDAAAFGKERWIIGENADTAKKGHVARFGQRARPGAAVRLALRGEDGAGGWAVAENEPPGKVDFWTFSVFS